MYSVHVYSPWHLCFYAVVLTCSQAYPCFFVFTLDGAYSTIVLLLLACTGMMSHFLRHLLRSIQQKEL